MSTIQFLLAIFILLALMRTVQGFRRGSMPLVNIFLWTAVWLGAIFVIMFPDSTNLVAFLVGITHGADLVTYVALLVAFYLIFRVHLTLARIERDITKVVRAIALDHISAPKN